MREFSFQERLGFSLGRRKDTDIETIMSILDGCESCVKTDHAMDLTGIDYVATLRRGAEVNIDAKARDAGASKFWDENIPDLALEIYSVVPESGRPGKPGWTLNESSNVDLILFTFDPVDTRDAFLIGFQHLRMAFRRQYRHWTMFYKHGWQKSESWTSECVFVPAPVVLSAITEASIWKSKAVVVCQECGVAYPGLMANETCANCIFAKEFSNG